VITSGCATYEPWASALGGIVGGLLVLPGSLFVLHVLKVDDPVDAVTVCYIGIKTHAHHVCCMVQIAPNARTQRSDICQS